MPGALIASVTAVASWSRRDRRGEARSRLHAWRPLASAAATTARAPGCRIASWTSRPPHQRPHPPSLHWRRRARRRPLHRATRSGTVIGTRHSGVISLDTQCDAAELMTDRVAGGDGRARRGIALAQVHDCLSGRRRRQLRRTSISQGPKLDDAAAGWLLWERRSRRADRYVVYRNGRRIDDDRMRQPRPATPISPWPSARTNTRWRGSTATWRAGYRRHATHRCTGRWFLRFTRLTPPTWARRARAPTAQPPSLTWNLVDGATAMTVYRDSQPVGHADEASVQRHEGSSAGRLLLRRHGDELGSDDERGTSGSIQIRLRASALDLQRG